MLLSFLLLPLGRNPPLTSVHSFHFSIHLLMTLVLHIPVELDRPNPVLAPCDLQAAYIVVMG